jgi:glucose-1-phosphate thymidylyltransferase
MTLAVSKQLLPVYDKPMLYYPLSLLMLAGIREILVITTPEDQPAFRRLLGDGAAFGLSLTYAVQPEPRGIAEAFLLGSDFIGGEPVALVLGDNLLYGAGLTGLLLDAAQLTSGARVFAYRVPDPQRYGVLRFDPTGRPCGLEEKPLFPPSSWVVIGLYFFDGRVVDWASRLQPSTRGELEISELNRAYLEAGELEVVKLGRGFAWLDAGTEGSLLAASEFVRTLQARTGLQLGCLEEIAHARGWVGLEHLRERAQLQAGSEYGKYLAALLADVEERDGDRTA